MSQPLGMTIRELLRQAFRPTREVYDWVASRFEDTPFRTPDHVLETAAREVGAGGPVGAALDLGCGTGAASRVFAPLCRDLLMGVDLSEGMLRVARRQWDCPDGPRLLLCQGDALAVPAGQAFDLVVSFGMFMHIEPRDLPRMVAEVARILKPAGRFAFITSYPPSRYSPWCWLMQAFNAAMRTRNRLCAPPLDLYYMGFMVPRAAALLRRHGFRVEVREGLFSHRRLALVIGTRI